MKRSANDEVLFYDGWKFWSLAQICQWFVRLYRPKRELTAGVEGAEERVLCQKYSELRELGASVVKQGLLLWLPMPRWDTRKER